MTRTRTHAHEHGGNGHVVRCGCARACHCQERRRWDASTHDRSRYSAIAHCIARGDRAASLTCNKDQFATHKKRTLTREVIDGEHAR